MDDVLEIRSLNFYDGLVDPDANLQYGELNSWLRSELQSVYPELEYYGWDFPGIHVTTRYRFAHDARWEQYFAGPSLDLHHPVFGGLRQRTMQRTDRSVVFVTTLKLPAQRIEAAQMEAFREFLDLLYGQTTLRVLSRLD